MPKITKLCLHLLKLCRKKRGLFFRTRRSCTKSAVFRELHDQLASREKYALLTRCFSAVAELLVIIVIIILSKS